MTRTIITVVSRVTDMRDGTFRPEIIWSRDDVGHAEFGKPVKSAKKAQRLAEEACEKGARAALGALLGVVATSAALSEHPAR
jgi:hypothetical protein